MLQHATNASDKQADSTDSCTGSGALPDAMIPVVKAQLLAFLIYTTPVLLQQQLQGVGQDQAQVKEGTEAEQKKPDLERLPGPCPVLRRLVTFDPGMNIAKPSWVLHNFAATAPLNVVARLRKHQQMRCNPLRNSVLL